MSNKRLNLQKREETKKIKSFFFLDMIFNLEIMNIEWYIKINEKRTYIDRFICNTFYSWR
jgi:hypothetical protein